MPPRSRCDAHRLFAPILPLFLDPDVPAITLADEATEIDLRAFFDEQFRAPASKHEFKVGGRDFTLHGFRLYGGAADHHDLVYGAHYREVITERLAKFLSNIANRLSDAEHGNFAYLAFVQGGYLDEKVNAERTDFSIPRDSALRGTYSSVVHALIVPPTDASVSQALIVRPIETAGGQNTVVGLVPGEIQPGPVCG
jgi:hypothetical protein